MLFYSTRTLKMGGIFGKKKPESRVTEQDKAVLQLKQQRDKMKQYQKKIQIQLEKERELAKKLLKDGRKDKAKLLLRKKKFQEGLLEKTDGQLDNIERMVHDLEFAQIESKVVQGLKSGNEALKKMHELMSIEDVERIMDETAEAVEYQQEVDAILAGGLSSQDEDDVLDELNEMIKSSLPQATEAEDMQLPDVPTHQLPEPSKEKKTHEREAVLAS